MKITRIRITNYRGIEQLEHELPPKGAIARGRNGAGKTTILRAIQAALLGQDVRPDAIRQGADRAEILVDLEDHTVKRVLTQKGQRLDVTRDGMKAPAPQAYLTQLLGTSSLDPLDLLTLKGKDRRARVLAALPAEVTREQLRQWWPDCPDSFRVDGHGLEVIAEARRHNYTLRTQANKEAKGAAAAAKVALEELEQATHLAPKDEPDLEAAQQTGTEAAAALERLRSRRAEAERQTAATSSARAQVVELRAKAAQVRDEAPRVPTDEVHQALCNRWGEQQDKVVALERELDEARKLEQELHQQVVEDERIAETARIHAGKAKDYEQRADDLERTLAETAVEPVPDEALAQAEQTLQDARVAYRRLQAEYQACLRRSEAQEAWQLSKAAEDSALKRAKELDKIVKRLDQAPAKLLAATEGIEGFTLEGDEVLLDGIRLDNLCGAEQVRFCVEVARRANSKSRILVVDGLERLDPEQLEVFVREATRDDYQLIATRVDRGDVVLEAIEAEHGGAK